jgi:hypothetical protein
MKNIKFIYAFTTLVLIAILGSCQKDEIIGGTGVQAVSGEWWIQTDDAGGGDFSDDYYKLSTYNTAANSTNEMWLDDGESYYGLKAKVNVDLATKTFTVTNADELYFGVTVTIKNGKIKTGVAKGPSSGAVTDSISFDAEFSDSPGDVYKFKGYRRTRFSGDDH